MAEKNHGALGSLTANYTDSDASDIDQDHNSRSLDDDESESITRSPGKISLTDSEHSQSTSTGPLQSQPKRPRTHHLVSYNDDHPDDIDNVSSEEELVDITDANINEETEIKIENETNGAESIDDVQIPPEPPGRCSNQLQEKIAAQKEKMLREGYDIVNKIQSRKDFRNPSIYEKLIIHCNIDEFGTNFPSDIYDPHNWSALSYYDELAKIQKVEMDKRTKDRQTKVEFVSGTAKKPQISSSAPSTVTSNEIGDDPGQKRKSKWDTAGVTIPALLPNPHVTMPVVSRPIVIASSSNTAGSSSGKATVISAFGTIAKKAKP